MCRVPTVYTPSVVYMTSLSMTPQPYAYRLGASQEVCRLSAEREAEMDRRLVSMQAHVATILPTIVQQSMQEGMTPPQSMKFVLSIVDVVNDIPQPPQPLQQVCGRV